VEQIRVTQGDTSTWCLFIGDQGSLGYKLGLGMWKKLGLGFEASPTR